MARRTGVAGALLIAKALVGFLQRNRAVFLRFTGEGSPAMEAWDDCLACATSLINILQSLVIIGD